MYTVIRIHTIVGPVRKRRAKWVHVKHLNTGFTHGPGSVRVVELYPLKDRKGFYDITIIVRTF